MNVLDLFSGIGGFSLGLERAGMRTVAFCEIEPYCRAVLKKHWPGVPIYDDVRAVTRERLQADGIAPDVVCGGFPCQDVSAAGARAGIDGERSGLWGELARIIGEVRPRYAVVENVTNLLAGPSEQPGQWYGRVLGDLAEIGYDAEWHCIPAAAVGAPHRRDRVWIVAYAARERRREARPDSERRSQRASRRGDVLADTNAPRLSIRLDRALGAPPGHAELERQGGPGWEGWPAEPDVGRVAHGVPSRVDRLSALGNAVVPQVVEIIGRAIMRAVEE